MKTKVIRLSWNGFIIMVRKPKSTICAQRRPRAMQNTVYNLLNITTPEYKPRLRNGTLLCVHLHMPHGDNLVVYMCSAHAGPYCRPC